MKKFLLVAASLLLSGILTQNASAACSQDGTTLKVTCTVGGVTGAQPLNFDPSSNVVMDVDGVVATAFAISAYHQQALVKSNGQAYGMASDSSQVYFQDISVAANTGKAAGTNQATSFTTALKWNPM